MLLKNLYSVKNIENTENTILAGIAIDFSHTIFKGHFPDTPILPGVVQLQIIKEIFTQATQIKASIQSASNIKYPAMIVPDYPNLNIKIAYQTIPNTNTYKISAQIFNNQLTFLKLKAIFTA
jgi:3-hydroxyacyl-[acyl-carrier-protein] dehydratase